MSAIENFVSMGNDDDLPPFYDNYHPHLGNPVYEVCPLCGVKEYPCYMVTLDGNGKRICRECFESPDNDFVKQSI